MSLRWLSIGSFALWLWALAPLAMLLAWLVGAPVVWLLLGSAVMTPLLTRRAFAALRGKSDQRRWWWLQSIGALALLMPLAAIAAPLTLIVSDRLVASLLVLVWAFVIVFAIGRAYRVHVETLSIETDRLSRPVRLVHLSDVHVGSRDTVFLQAVIAQVQRHEPDLVVITGDLLDQRSVDRERLAPLAGLTCPVYMSIGNHERYVDLAHAVREIEQTGVHVLRDAAVDVLGLRLVGIDDRDRPDSLPALLGRWAGDTAPYRVLLYHRPDGWAAARAAGFPLMLAGHTHAGQIWPFGLLVRRRYPEMVGRFERDGHLLYVSPGAGTWGPTLRFGTRSEMTVLEIGPAA